MDGSGSHPGAAGRRRGFDFTAHMARLCADIVARVPELGHVDLARVAIRYSQTRKAVAHGVQAALTPLRFEGGALYTQRAGRRWTIQRVCGPDGREMLYLLSFYLPRFLNHTFREKLITVFHELWHINPSFNGDLRRLPGRCYAHGQSERSYDASIEQLVSRWLALSPPAEVCGFLHYDFRQLCEIHGAVYGVKIVTPKIVAAEMHPA